MASGGPQNGWQDLERDLPLGFWALPSTFYKWVVWFGRSFYEKSRRPRNKNKKQKEKNVVYSGRTLVPKKTICGFCWQGWIRLEGFLKTYSMQRILVNMGPIKTQCLSLEITLWICWAGLLADCRWVHLVTEYPSKVVNRTVRSAVGCEADTADSTAQG